ncbi:uncharacterized protein MP3633_1859 [Marinomonas primoryensis]|uniref:Uncharacterized protein n=1 Tax=Marinomonas primoryensis TaxID=178399 RepID=A0A859CVN3_9GAMM|nr:uncharacterized protein MP3633_1859 [Marinomonas primoryensis]
MFFSFNSLFIQPYLKRSWKQGLCSFLFLIKAYYINTNAKQLINTLSIAIY